MQSEPKLFRPPYESRSLLLPVTEGCSHNACTFCTMYRDIPFRALSEAEIMEGLEKAKAVYEKYGRQPNRVFLEHGDAFALSFDRLRRIAEMIHETLPGMESIGCYCSIQNIRGKTPEELQKLHALGYDKFDIGVESGLDEVLQNFNKGYTVEEAKAQLAKLKSAGIQYAVNIVIGAQGNGQYRENALANARFLNKTQPFLIFTATLSHALGSPLDDKVRRGKFQDNTLRQLLEEQKLLIEHLTLDNVMYFGLHSSNPVPVWGELPARQQILINRLGRRLEELSDERLDAIPSREAVEGGIFL